MLRATSKHRLYLRGGAVIMKINKGAFIFIVILGGLALIVAGVIAFSNFFKEPSANNAAGTDNLFSSLFPFGQGAARPNTGSGGQEEEQPLGPVPVLREISREPVAGFHVSSTSSISYVERDTGHISRTSFDSLGTTRLTNTTFPGIERATWLSENNVIFQSTDGNTIRNVLISFSTSTVDQTVSGKTLSAFSSVAAVPARNQLILTAGTAANTTISTSNYDTEQRAVIFSSPLRSWHVVPAGKNVFVETAPSDDAGFLYAILENGELRKIIGNIRGLMAVARNDGAYLAVSSADGGGVRLSVFTPDGMAAGNSPVATFAEKCAWFPGKTPLLACGVPRSVAGASVEAWFMGLQSFNDGVWIVNPVQETATFVRNLENEAGRPIDIIDPQVSPDGKYFLFKNKNDLSFWSLDLTR